MAQTLDHSHPLSPQANTPSAGTGASAAPGLPARERRVALEHRAALAAVLGAFALLFAGAGFLWARHGGTVFLDTLMAGIGACL